MEIEPSPLNETRSAPHLRLSVVWITGQLYILLIRSARHRQSSETQIKMCQAQIKAMAISLLQELQSSVRPGPRYGPVGNRRLKSGLFNWYVIVGILEVFGHNHADLQSVTPALAHDRRITHSHFTHTPSASPTALSTHPTPRSTPTTIPLAATVKP